MASPKPLPALSPLAKTIIPGGLYEHFEPPPPKGLTITHKLSLRRTRSKMQL
jgi:hypothetical protein